MLLDQIGAPEDLRELSEEDLEQLATEVRAFIVASVARSGGHLGSNLGAVELTFALHRVFSSPSDVLLWDTGHQAYVHKLLTGRREGFQQLRQAGGLSGYPARAESEHDWVENSHASTILSYAHGLATALHGHGRQQHRRVVAVVGDGAMTGGMAYEALNNLGHSGRRVVIVLNDNGRSYAETVSRLSESLSMLRLHPSFVHARERLEEQVRHLPGGELALSGWRGMRAAFREVIEPPSFFEALGVRYTGPIDGHDIPRMEQALRHAAAFEGPIVVHVRTQKGRGYPPAETDVEKCLHDTSAFDPATGRAHSSSGNLSYTHVFSDALVRLAEERSDVVAITAAMPGSTGLLPLAERYPDRVIDVGIAEQHAVTSAAGMAMGGLRPVVAVYSTFFSRAFDQANLDVGLHGLPVTYALDRAGITGDDGPSHHGVLDLALCLKIPGMTIFAPSSAQELARMLPEAVALDGPAVVRFPKGSARTVGPDKVGRGLRARQVRSGERVCLLAVGKLLAAAEEAAELLAVDGVDATVWDVRVAKPLDREMLADAAAHELVVTVEDGTRIGGVGAFIADALADLNESRSTPSVLILGTPDTYIPQAKPDRILAEVGLNGPGIAASVRKTLGDTP